MSNAADRLSTALSDRYSTSNGSIQLVRADNWFSDLAARKAK
jgi:hypothetical protein